MTYFVEDLAWPTNRYNQNISNVFDIVTLYK